MTRHPRAAFFFCAALALAPGPTRSDEYGAARGGPVILDVQADGTVRQNGQADESAPSAPQETAPPSTAPPAEAPPPAPSKVPPPPSSVPEGQWVYTAQYGWIWMPYSDLYTYVPPSGYGAPYQYVYYPYYGWSWIVAPWVWGYGPWPYFGFYGAVNFAWYGHGYWRYPAQWGYYPPAHHGGHYHGGVPYQGVRPAPAPHAGGVPARTVGPAPYRGAPMPYRGAPAPMRGGGVAPRAAAPPRR